MFQSWVVNYIFAKKTWIWSLRTTTWILNRVRWFRQWHNPARRSIAWFEASGVPFSTSIIPTWSHKVRATYTRICCYLSLPCGVRVIDQGFLILIKWIAGRERMCEVMWFGRFWTTLSGRVDMTIDLVYIILITTTT